MKLFVHEDGYLLCPQCGLEYSHVNKLFVEGGGEDRAEITEITIGLWCENDHRWLLSIGQRKGYVFIHSSLGSAKPEHLL